MDRITVDRRKPRNPLVAPALFRRAGSHRIERRTERRRARLALQAELKQMKPDT